MRRFVPWVVGLIFFTAFGLAVVHVGQCVRDGINTL